jgi:hypothetical protein
MEGRATGLQHLHQVMGRRHTTVGYMFGFLTIEDNTGASPKVVKQALEALDKFSMPSIADLTIRNWICSVCEDIVLIVRRYEIELISLSWERQFLHAKMSDLPHCLNLGCQVMVFENR